MDSDPNTWHRDFAARRDAVEANGPKVSEARQLIDARARGEAKAYRSAADELEAVASDKASLVLIRRWRANATALEASCKQA